jgi:hypothetical protein
METSAPFTPSLHHSILRPPATCAVEVAKGA